jgi:hypothetical protein
MAISEVYALSVRPLVPGRVVALISFRDWVDPRAIVRLEGFGKLKNPVTSVGIKPACSIVPQPTTLLPPPPHLPPSTSCPVEMLVCYLSVAVVWAWVFSHYVLSLLMECVLPVPRGNLQIFLVFYHIIHSMLYMLITAILICLKNNYYIKCMHGNYINMASLSVLMI